MRSEIKEVVTLAHKPDVHHNRYLSRHSNGGFALFDKYKLDYTKQKRLLANVNVPYYVNENVYDLYFETDWKSMRNFCAFGIFYPIQFKRTMNIRLQYSKKVKCKN